MKSDYHRKTILLTNGIHREADKPSHTNSSSIFEATKSTSTQITSPGSSGYTNGSQVKGSGNMSFHDDARLTHKVNLAAAFHDHISCTKLPSHISKNGGDINSLIGASLNNGSCLETSNSLFGAATGSSIEDKIQIKKLKEMILMQLDLIQHQQEQLLKKERQLQGLKHDRETLFSKIDKMDSRINFLTRKLVEANSSKTISSGSTDNNTHLENISELNVQNSDPEALISCLSDTNDVSTMFTNVYSTSSPTSTAAPTTLSLKPNPDQPVESSNQSNQVSCGTQTISSGDIDDSSDKSKSTVNSNDIKGKVDGSKSKKSSSKRKRPSRSSSVSVSTSTSSALTTTSTTTSASTPSTTTTTSTTTSKNSISQIVKEEPVSTDKLANSESSNEEIAPQPSKKRRRTVSKSGNSTSTPSDQLQQQQPETEVTSKTPSTKVNILETDEPYDLYNCRLEKSIIERMETSPNDAPVRINQIEVPSWRIINLPDSNSTEGIENLDDDTYLKRHTKLENDERRRKRWDIQRLREQKLNEKLRSGRYYYSTVNFDKPTCSSSQRKQSIVDLISFFPVPKEVQFIEVSDKIPVMAFGLPIPKLPPKNFALPWLKPPTQS